MRAAVLAMIMIRRLVITNACLTEQAEHTQRTKEFWQALGDQPGHWDFIQALPCLQAKWNGNALNVMFATLGGQISVRALVGFPLDDLEPVAPLDRLSETQAVGPAGVASPTGGSRRPALYVPPYLYPDAFPRSASDQCKCEAPKQEELSEEDHRWAAEVAKQLNLPLAQVMEPNSVKGIAHCDCGSAPAAGQVFRYVKATAGNSSGFTLKSADFTFPLGSFWEPEVIHAGLIAPGDRLPKEDLPPQAPYDEVSLGEDAYAKEDRIPTKFARYFDQLEKREGCEGDCRSPCRAGDEVQFQLGNVLRPASILATSAGDAAEIQFTTGLEGGACPAEAGCSLWRVCAPVDTTRQCVAQNSEERRVFQLQATSDLRVLLRCKKPTQHQQSQ
ncbi:unnamed protein product [Effrenium voratum]|nr:unnamed protein product [Effrenium voratum]